MACNREPWDSGSFVAVPKEEFFEFIKNDKRDIMPTSVYRPRKEGSIYSVWKVQARGNVGEVVGYTFSVDPVVGGQKNERYVVQSRTRGEG